MKHYVLGFLFSPDKTHVALIRKNKPDWQKGKLNGIGGKVEADDPSYFNAMVREFEEETGVVLLEWKHFATLFGDPDVRVYCYRASGDFPIRTTTDETVAWQPVNKLDRVQCVPNLHWLVPLAIDGSTSNTQATLCE